MSVAPLHSPGSGSSPSAAATSLVDLLHARAIDAFERPAVITCSPCGSGLPMPSRRTFAAALRASTHCVSASLRHPWLRSLPQPARGHAHPFPQFSATEIEMQMTWGGLIAAALDYARVIEAAGLVRGDRLAHIAPHSAEWIIVDLACLLSGVVHVALHADESPTHIDEQLKWLAPQGLVAYEVKEARGSAQLDRAAIIHSLAERAAVCDPDAPAAIFLSSGTTGLPRGVVHSQRALAWNAWASSSVFLDDPRDVRLSWLPLSHAYARVGDLYSALVRGGTLCVVGDRRRVLDACAAARPTVILGVPAFFERVAAAVEAGRITDLPAALGGAVRVCVSGGAPLKDRTAAAFASRGVPLVQGYGLAEAGPVVALASPRTMRPGAVGPLLPDVDVAIGARGQLLVRTPSVALGVIEPGDPALRPATTDGWLATGDTASRDDDGQVRITGRVVDTLVLSSGVKVPPAEVERALAEDPVVAQVCVLGDGLAAPVALVVPEPDVVRAAMRRLGLRVLGRRQALRHPRLVRWLARRLAARQASLPRAWRVRRAAFVARPFDAAHGEATSSFKLKRPAVAAHFARLLTAAQADPPPAWIARVPPAEPPRCGLEHGTSPLAESLWHDRAGGFEQAAAESAAPLRDAVAAVVDHARSVITHLRLSHTLHDPPRIPPDLPAAPLADAPPLPTGVFSAAAEASLGDVGLWGLAVPEPHGGTGATMHELARAISAIAAEAPTAAGLLSVHSSIGAVSAVTAFGSPDQQARLLPGLAQGRPLSIFGATEADAGCDLSAVATTIDRSGDGLAVSGTKMFITGATHGRLVKLLALRAGRPTVALVRLPDADTPFFRLRRYAIHPLKHAHNAALEFDRFPLDPADILAPPASHGGTDAMRIIWHGLNRGRITLAAQAAGTLRILLAQAREHALRRTTWGRPIAARELVQGRLGRIAARIVACDALAAWAATAIDSGGSGELEALTAKIVASECVRDGAIDALGVHGGRAFLVGHPLGDSLHDHFAVTVYEGESGLLGLALFKGLAKRHPLAALAHDSAAISRAGAWLAWRAGTFARGSRDGSILALVLREHARRARHDMARAAVAIDRAIRRHGRSLADRQLEIGALSARVRDLASILAAAHHADATADDRTVAAADVWCRLARARVAGRHLTAADHAAVAALGARAALADHHG